MRVKRSVLERLEDFRAWGRTGAAPGGDPITLLDYVGFVARPDFVFAFAELFFPELVEHEGRKYLASRFSSAAYDAWIEPGRSAEETQRLMNYLHVCWLIQTNRSMTKRPSRLRARLRASGPGRWGPRA